MSRLGERIGRRLAKRHGFKFLYDPCNFRVASDREGVERNVRGGQGVMQWVLRLEGTSELPTISFRGKGVTAEIGACFGASTVVKWKHWHVYFDEDLTGPGCPECVSPIIWIDDGHGEDEL